MTLKRLSSAALVALLTLGTLVPTATAAGKARAQQNLQKKILAGELASDARPLKDADREPSAAGGMETRKWTLSPLLVEQARVDYLGGNADTEATPDEEMSAIEKFLTEHGIAFPAGSEMNFNHCGSIVTITNTATNLDAINDALLEHGPAMLQKAKERHKGAKKSSKRSKPRRERRSRR